jgi:hypothetical protein
LSDAKRRRTLGKGGESSKRPGRQHDVKPQNHEPVGSSPREAWTGPRYKFNAAGNARAFTASVATPAICNTQFQVELASDDTFTTNLVVSGWQKVSTTFVPECYGIWTPSGADWDTIKGAAGHVKVYYRLRTRDAVDANEKISTSPGNGLFTVPPAYIIANDSGTP